MEEIAISKFKATCLAVLERVRRTQRPVLITRFGEPVAQVVPPPAPASRKGWLGTLKSSGQIRGDIVAPAADATDWETLRS
jgi:prevent-host-death family protein